MWRLCLDEQRDVVHQSGELRRQAVERVRDELLEVLRPHGEHVDIVLGRRRRDEGRTKTRARRALSAALLAVVGLLGAWLGLLVLGHVVVPIGPVQTRLSVAPSFTGDSVVRIPPLGRLTLDSHDGPLQLDAEVQQLDPQDARRLV